MVKSIISAVSGGITGSIGSVIGSPFFLMKIRFHTMIKNNINTKQSILY